MSKYISLTSGSKPILLNIIRQNPQFQLYLYKSSTENTFYLFDWKDKGQAFKFPITYQIIKETGQFKNEPFINLIYFTLSHKQRNLLLTCVRKQITDGLPVNMRTLFIAQSIQNSSQIMIGSGWSSNQTYLKWIHLSFIKSFISNPMNDSFHNGLIQIQVK